jgi:hypothetical protein
VPFEVQGLGEGYWNLEVRAIDPFTWEVTQPAASALVRVDRTGPGIDLAARPLQRTASGSATIRFVPTEATAGSITCQLGSKTPVDCSDGDVGFSNLSAGNKVVQIRATDLLGNAAVTKVSWTIDRTPPIASILSGPPLDTTDTTPTFSLKMNEGGLLLCALDAWPPTPCKGSPELGTVGPGTHTLVVTAEDKAYNISAPVSWTWMVS